MTVAVDGDAAYNDVLAVLRDDIPVEAGVDGYTFDEHILAVDWGNAFGEEDLSLTSLAVEDALCHRGVGIHQQFDVQSFLLVRLIDFAIGRWSDDAALARHGDVLCSVGIDEGTERIDFYTFVASEDLGQVVLDVAAEVQFAAIAEVQFHARLEGDSSRMPAASGDDNLPAAFLCHFVDGLLDGLGRKSAATHPNHGFVIIYHRPLHLGHVKRRCNGVDVGGHAVWPYEKLLETPLVAPFDDGLAIGIKRDWQEYVAGRVGGVPLVAPDASLVFHLRRGVVSFERLVVQVGFLLVLYRAGGNVGLPILR